MARLAVHSANLILPEEIAERGVVVIEDGRIVEISDRAVQADEAVNAEGAYLLPGIVDLHNDGLEQEINPRPDADLPLPMAIGNFERRLIAAGVTTEFHAIAFFTSPAALRTLDGGWGRAKYIADLHRNGVPLVDHQVLHRFDVWSPEPLELIFESMADLPIGYFSINDHTPGQGQYRDFAQHMDRMAFYRARRGGPPLDVNEMRNRMLERQAAAAAGTVTRIYEQIAELAGRQHCVIATHDDDSVEKVEAQAGIGATVCEFPITVEAAKRARALGMTIVVGAPNIVRGGSTGGNLRAADQMAAGLADVICSDYHAPSLLPAAFRLVSDGVVDLPTAVRSLTLNAARAVGMHDRGSVAVGKKADLILVRVINGAPCVEMVFREGVPVYTYRGQNVRELVGTGSY